MSKTTASRTDQALPQLWAAALADFQAGRLVEAEAGYRRFLALAPHHPAGNYNLAVTLKGLGRLAEAAAQYRLTLSHQPENAKAHNNLGVILAALGDDDQACAHYEHALKIKSDYSNAHYNIANLLRKQGQVRRAIDQYRRSLDGAPDDPETHNNLGIALAAVGASDAAIGHYRRALALRPGYAAAYSNLGSALEQVGLTAEGLACFDRALELDPAYADAHFNRGHALHQQDAMKEALAHYERALALNPMHAEAHNNLGLLCEQLGWRDEALGRFFRAQELKPDYADAHWNEALARLLIGDFAVGWRKYEWRWRRKQTPPRALAAAPWDGASLIGKTILLHAEQGQGDAIQFVRYAALVKARGGTVLLECTAPLQRLFARLGGVDVLVSAGAPMRKIDVHAPLLSLPGLFGTTADTMPALVPYLLADEALSRDWRERLGHSARRKVGLVWRGNAAHSNDRRRSITASSIAGLIGSETATWVCLQTDARPEEIAAFKQGALFDAGPWLQDWADTAALIEVLDLVITVDTAVAHLAGALGKPVWMLTPFAPDWRWLLDRSDSPWYPTMRLFRQPAPGDWASVLAQVSAALRAPAASPAPAVHTIERRLPAAVVVSHERSGTHFLMNALSYGYGYTAEPWIDLDVHNSAVDGSSPLRLATSLQAEADNPLFRIVKSHHAAGMLGSELEQITRGCVLFYIYRDPAAVMVSLWRHLHALNWDEGPRTADPLALARARPGGRLRRYQAGPHPTMLARWAAHVDGWLDAARGDPRIVPVRYEDLDCRYEQTLSAFSGLIGRDPMTPFLRPPRDVNVIAMGGGHAGRPVAPANWEALRAHCKAELGPLLERLGY